MNTYSKCTMKQKKTDYLNIVLPHLIKFGHEEQKMKNLFKNGQVRVRWEKDWNNFTIHLSNPQSAPTCKMDNLIHLIWGGTFIFNRLVMSCFIKNKKTGPVSSLAMTDLYTLANGMKRYGVIQKTKNSFNGQTFMTLPFSHPSLSNNIWGTGIKN